jgi:uncharacterized protein YuzE
VSISCGKIHRTNVSFDIFYYTIDWGSWAKVCLDYGPGLGNFKVFSKAELCYNEAMQINFDSQADVLYIQFRQGEVDDTLEAGKYVYVDVDQDGVPLGLEILFAGRLLAEEDMTSVTVNIGRMAQPVPASEFTS